LLDEHLEKSPSTPPDKFTKVAKENLIACYSASKLKEQNLTPEKAWQADEPTLAALYQRLHELHAAGRNGLWARIIKNAFAPVFLAPFDYVAGNPPWIGWENLPEGYRNETKDLWHQHGLFVHSGMDTILGKGKKDISMLVTYVAADSYLKDGGKLGFVITQAVFKMAGAAQGFRRFKTRRRAPLNCIFVDDFSELQLFEGATNKTAVFVMRKGEPQKYPVSYTYWQKKEAGRKGSFDYDATLEEVVGKTERKNWAAEPAETTDPTSAWLTGNRSSLKAVKNVLGASDYHAHEGINSGGANAVYWFEVLTRNTNGTSRARNLTEGAKRKVESQQVELEDEALMPLLRLQDVEPFDATPGAHFLFVQDVNARKGRPEADVRTRLPKAFAWLDRHRAMLKVRSAYKRYFDEAKASFFTVFNTGPYTLSPIKVVWRAIDNRIRAAVVTSHEGKIVIPQHIVSFISLTDIDEAHYICGVLNSTPFRFAVSCFSQPGSKSFGTPSILEKARIPKFDTASALHQQIAAEARRLSSGAADASEPVHQALDALCKDLWGLTEQELDAVEFAYRELYVSAPKESSDGEPASEE
jgi:hypothetical protein